MAIPYPALCPSSRSFTLPDYPNSPGEWHGGSAAYPRGWSDTPVNCRLDIGYQNIADVSAAEFMEAWEDSLSGSLELLLPTNIIDGIESIELQDRILNPTGLSWRFAQAPSITNVFPGISSVQVSLEAEAPGNLIAPGAILPGASRIFGSTEKTITVNYTVSSSAKTNYYCTTGQFISTNPPEVYNGFATGLGIGIRMLAPDSGVQQLVSPNVPASSSALKVLQLRANGSEEDLIVWGLFTGYAPHTFPDLCTTPRFDKLLITRITYGLDVVYGE